MAVIYFVMGVSGSGKTTIAQRLSELKNIPLFDADDFHSTENKAKMSAGQPLNDEDRKGWLDTLNKLAIKQSHADGAVIACSCLLYTSDAAADPLCVALGGRSILKKKHTTH